MWWRSRRGCIAVTPFLSHTQRDRSAGLSDVHLSTEIVLICHDQAINPPLHVPGSGRHQVAVTHIGSNCIDCIQAHRLLPPPLMWQRPSPPFGPRASRQDWSHCHVRRDHLALDLDVFGNAKHATFTQGIRRLRIDPIPVSSPLWSKLPSHLVRRAGVESLKPCQGQVGEIPRLTSVQ